MDDPENLGDRAGIFDAAWLGRGSWAHRQKSSGLRVGDQLRRTDSRYALAGTDIHLLFLRRHGAELVGLHRWRRGFGRRSEEHTSELQSLMRISYAVFCLKKKRNKNVKNTL